MPYATLPERGLITLSGEEVVSFLQGLVSNDVLRLHESGIVYAAMLTPQGKFLHDFFILSYGQSVLIDSEKSRQSELLKRLMMYRLRSKVTMEIMPDSFGVAALWNEPEVAKPAADISIFCDPRVSALGWRVYGDIKQVASWCQSYNLKPVNVDDYDRHRLTLGVPVGGSDLIPEKSFLLQFGFEDLHGVDFAKGCYVGQEVTARSKHLGQVRKFIYKVHSKEPLPGAGSLVYHGETLAGELRSSRGNIGLALMSVEEVEKANTYGKHFFCGNRLVQAILPDWVKNAPGSKA